MHERDWLAARFEEHRPRLRGIAYRMLGSLSDADDALQEAWLRVGKARASEVENLGGWLTTIVSRTCLDVLRARRSRSEESLTVRLPDPIVDPADGMDPEHEALIADSIGLAMLVVLETLSPAERIAFVLHDVFAVPFDEIGPIVDRTPTAARKLASRARRRVRGAPMPDTELGRQREVADTFFRAARAGDFEGLMAVLDPNVVLRSDAGPRAPSLSGLLIGAAAVARSAVAFARAGVNAVPVLINGAPGAVSFGPDGMPESVLAFTIAGGRIAEIEILRDQERLGRLHVPVRPS